MDWQLLVVAVLVALSAAYLLRRAWRTWKGRGSGCATCSCDKHSPAGHLNASGSLISRDELTLRLRRRGETGGR